jgi:hypothetical protein
MVVRSSQIILSQLLRGCHLNLLERPGYEAGTRLFLDLVAQYQSGHRAARNGRLGGSESYYQMMRGTLCGKKWPPGSDPFS